MILIKNLSKVYPGEHPVTALDNINIDLPNKGMVFIIGKSGSGKTTFLNVLGCLDNATSGDIFADNIHVNRLSEAETSKYRNEYLGFIFQDYCLIDNLTVEENISLSLKLQNIEDKENVQSVIDLVGLTGMEKRLPKTLSAGQKQRVAIARGYIKQPRLLLCDEPTGNLDSKTSTQILDLLKKLSETTLVLVVSHNVDDAYTYGDRIIKINDGKIIEDISDNSNKKNYEITDSTLYISNVNSLSDDDLSSINKDIENKKIKKIANRNALFVQTTSVKDEPNDIEIKDHKYTFKNKLRMSMKFQKKRLLSTSIICLFSALIAVIFGLSQFFTLFNKNDVIKQSLRNNDQVVFSMRKAYYDDAKKKNANLSSLIAIDENDIEAVNKSDYKGNTYQLYNYSLPLSLKSWTLQGETPINDSANLRTFYAQEIYGVLPVNENYLKQVFGNYKLTGSLNDKEYGIVITDFVADSILFYRGDMYASYEDIIGTYKNNTDSVYGYINGIIHTNYKDKYTSLLDLFKKYEEDPLHFDMDTILLSDDYLHFFEDVKNYLGIAYSTNADFMKSANNVLARNFVRIDDSKIEFADHQSAYINTAYAPIDDLYLGIIGRKLEENTLGISLATLNNLLNTKYTIAEAEVYNGQPITLSKFRHHHEDNVPAITKTLKLKVFDTGYFSYIVSDDVFTSLREYDMIPYSLYFDDLSSASYAYYALNEIPFVPNSSYIEAGAAINNVVIVFNDFFVLVAFTLLSAITLMLIFHSLNNINVNKYEIGVFKSLGMKEKDIVWIFIYQIIFSTILISLLYGVGIVIFSRIANKLLFNSFMSYLKNPALKAINIIAFHPWVFVIDIAIIFLLNALTTLIPFFFMKKVKPLNILRRQ